jgi:ferredoxin
MTHVVTARCIDCRYTDCVEACPVDCFWEIKDPHMLVIDPDTCIDCTLCVAECPIKAIWPEDDLPEEYAEWTEKNAELFSDGENITEVDGPLPNAKDLDQIHAEEQAKGWDIDDPA